MSYVDKYIKNLKPEDLSLSIWGGDVVLQNLELNLDVLQKVYRYCFRNLIIPLKQ